MNRFVHAIYCDDIRQEIGNKLTLVGVYGTELYVTEFPAIMARFGMLITVVTPASKPLKQLSIRLMRNNEVLLDREADPAELVRGHDENSVASLQENLSDDQEMLHVVKQVLNISTFVFTGPCLLRVIAMTESEELRCPALRIRLTPSVDSAGGETSPMPPGQAIGCA